MLVTQTDSLNRVVYSSKRMLRTTTVEQAPRHWQQSNRIDEAIMENLFWS